MEKKGKGKLTIRDVAEACNVSVATVSYILNGKRKVSEQTKQKVLDMIKKLEYVPDLNARGLTVKDTKLIGVVVPQTEPGSTLMFRNNFYGEILGSIEWNARQYGYHVLVSGTDVTADYLRLIQERNLDGVIIIGSYENDFFTQLKTLGIPVVLVDSYCHFDYFPVIGIEDKKGSHLATKYVIDQGHREIAFAVGRLHEEGIMLRRMRGYLEAFEEAGIPCRQDWILEGNVDYDSGVEIARQIASMEKRPTAVVAAADVLAIGLIRGFFETGVKVPEDISVIGFDDLDISRYLTPGLTTIRQPISEKGKQAVELLVEQMAEDSRQIEKPQTIVMLPMTLVIRESVKQINE
jgi:LacI family transcriptional regulator